MDPIKFGYHFWQLADLYLQPLQLSNSIFYFSYLLEAPAGYPSRILSLACLKPKASFFSLTLTLPAIFPNAS